MIDLIFSFDETGSMHPCTYEVKRKIKETALRLFKDIPDLRIGLIAHGDYCDHKDYIIEALPLTNDPGILASWISTINGVNGGDNPEAYELVLHQAALMGCRTGAQKVLIVVGDEVPHEPSYRNVWTRDKVHDWREELNTLKDMGVIVHGVQCLGRKHANTFYQTLAKATGGARLELNQFSNVAELIHAVAYQQSGQLDEYATELQGKGMFNRGLAAMINQLQGKPEVTLELHISGTSYGKTASLDAVPPSRFQVLHVDKTCVIQDFIKATGAKYVKGRGFYQFTKPEIIQHHKEIVLQDKATGDMFTGDKAREMAGISTSTARIRPYAMDKYNVFVQSTSYTRKLMPNTLFLYEVEEWE